MKRILSAILWSAAAVGCAPTDSTSASQAINRSPVQLQILDISDWHGQLDPLSVSGVGLVGGAPVLSAYFQADRAANPNTLTLTAGDAFSATPVLSALFNDTPTVLAENMMGIQADTFGNHNFDHGLAYLQDRIHEAQFQYVDADLTNLAANLSGVAPYKIFDVGGVKVAVVGGTNPDAADLVKPGSMGTMTVRDPIPALNAARAQAMADGAQVTVAIVHMGVTGFDQTTGAPLGPLVDFANNVGGFDFILGDHTDVKYSGILNGALVTENRSKGLTYVRIHASVDPGNGHVLDKSAEFVTPLASAVTPDPAIAAMLAAYRAQLGPVESVVIGNSTVAIPRADSCGNGVGRTCESLIGDVVTDAMRFETVADFAITNSGGIRADLTCPTTDIATDFCPPFTPPPYPITNGQVQTVLPFGNVIVQVRVTGSELKTMLENGVSQMPLVAGRFPQVSGMCATYDISQPAGSRVTTVVRQAADGSCTGGAVDLTDASSYLVLENDFMAAGGDGYPNVTSRVTTLNIMADQVMDYFQHVGTVSPVLQGRVACTTSGATNCPVTL